MFTREDAWKLLREWTAGERLLKHALAVETAMRALAEKFGGDAESWGMAGLLHDMDYEKHPGMDEHPFEGAGRLAELGYPEEIRRAVLSHAEHTGVARESMMEKALFACDELCGFLIAIALVRPDRRIAGVEARSVRKKMKDKAFARAVSRDDMLKGAQELGMEFDELVACLVKALSARSDQLGL